MIDVQIQDVSVRQWMPILYRVVVWDNTEENELKWRKIEPVRLSTQDMLDKLPAVAPGYLRTGTRLIEGEFGRKLRTELGERDILIRLAPSGFTSRLPVYEIIVRKEKDRHERDYIGFVEKRQKWSDVAVKTFEPGLDYVPEIERMQVDLLATGDYHGLVHGRLDTSTMEAVRKFVQRTQSPYFQDGKVNTLLLRDIAYHASYEWVPITRSSSPERIYELTTHLVRWGLLKEPTRQYDDDVSLAVQRFKAKFGATITHAGSIQGGITSPGLWGKLHAETGPATKAPEVPSMPAPSFPREGLRDKEEQLKETKPAQKKWIPWAILAAILLVGRDRNAV